MTQYNCFNYTNYPWNNTFEDDYGYYPSSAGVSLTQPTALTVQSEYDSMTKKVAVEVEGDTKENTKNLVIKKQAEVWVWNDQVFATKALAVAASKRERVIEVLVKHQFAGSTAAQRASYIKNMKTNASSYTFYGNQVLSAIEEILSEDVS